MNKNYDLLLVYTLFLIRPKGTYYDQNLTNFGLLRHKFQHHF